MVKPEVEIMKNLYTKTLVSLVALTVVMGFLLFVPAGTIQYWQVQHDSQDRTRRFG